LRHVRIIFNFVSPEFDDDELGPHVPAWFAALARPEIAERKLRVVAGNGEPIVILGEPADEIAEA